MAGSNRFEVPNTGSYDPSWVGVTSDGIGWAWNDGPVPSSRLLLLAATDGQLTKHGWRVEESQRMWELFDLIHLPNVGIEWVEPNTTEALTPGLAIQDHYPRWEIAGEIHGGAYGITTKLWSALSFDPKPPIMLAKQWSHIKNNY